MSVGQGEQARHWQRDIAAATVALSNAVLGFGEAIAGSQALADALGAEIDEDPAGYGVNEDDRRPPEDGEAWVCPEGRSADYCRTMHDHYPTPTRRGDRT